MVRRLPAFYPQRVNLRVPGMEYYNGVDGDDIVSLEFGAPAALGAALILSAQNIAAAGNAVVFAGTYTGSEVQMSRWGRGVSVVASGASSAVVTITGRDYLGQRMVENITLNGTTTVNGVKAFRYIDRVDWAAGGVVTMNVGLSNVLGLKLRFQALINEIKNGIATANAGTFVPGLAAATVPTATNADVRGTYLPVTVIPDGVNTFVVRYIADNANLHGVRQFS